MQLVSFDVFRTLGFPETTILKPEHTLRHKELLREADWVLFPEYWQLNALVYGLNCRVFPSEASYRIGHDKVEMTRAFEMVAPAHIPLTLIEPNTPESAQQVWEQMALPFVAKLPKASMGQGVWLIENKQDWHRYCAKSSVLYVQEYLPIDRDVRVVIVGDKVVTAYWRTQSERGFYNNVAQGGGIDYSVGSHPYVLEFNRLFGNQGLGGAHILKDAILAYLASKSEPEDPDGKTPVWPIAV